MEILRMVRVEGQHPVYKHVREIEITEEDYWIDREE